MLEKSSILPRLDLILIIFGLILTLALSWLSWRSLDRLVAGVVAISGAKTAGTDIHDAAAGQAQTGVERRSRDFYAGTDPLPWADHAPGDGNGIFPNRLRHLQKEVMQGWLFHAGTLFLGFVSCGLLAVRIRRAKIVGTTASPELFCVASQASGQVGKGERPLPYFPAPVTENQSWEPSHKLLQLILDNIPQYVFWKDRHSIYQGCNRNFALAAGVGEPENIVGKNDHDLAWANEESDWYRKCDREVMDSGIALYHIAESQLRADGKKTWIDTNKIPLHDAAGKVIGILGTYEDITERKLVEENLAKALKDAEQAREKIDAILKSMTDGLLAVDTEGRIQLMNRVAEKIAGIAPDSGLARPLEKVIAEKGLVEQIGRTLKGKGRGKPLEWKVYDPSSGKNKTLLALTSKVKNHRGEVTGTLTLLRDVTREREVDRMKNEFIATAAHELRTPLTTLMGFSEILMKPEEFGIGGEEQKRQFVAAIHESARRLNLIVSDLLDLSRVQSGRMISLHRVPWDITALLREQVRKYRSEKKLHTFTCAFPEQAVPLLIDPAKLEQVADNLISNAVKFSAAGTTVHVSGEIIGDTFQVTVTDQGMGMTAEQVERAFDKFYRVDTSDTAPEGLGLGMAIAKNIIEAHGGRIWLESEVCAGTRACFSLKLPQSSPTTDGDKNLPDKKGDLL